MDERFGHPWHHVTPGGEVPRTVNAVVEIPKGSKGKYELDKGSGLLRLDRVLYSSVHYPANYGFIPQTYCDDHDPLDILVISSIDVFPLCLVEAKVIGVMHMIDEDEQDDKIISVAARDMAVNYVNDIAELPPHTVVELQRFFEDYKKLEHKRVKVEEFLGRDHACRIVTDAVKLYSEKRDVLMRE